MTFSCSTRGGRPRFAGVYSIDQLTDYDFGHTLAVIKGGEMLDFVDTPKNRVVLTELGRRFLEADVNHRKELFRERLLTLGVFRFIQQILSEAAGKRLPAEVVQEELAVRLTTEDIDRLFHTVVGWGRYAELFGYSPDQEVLYLDTDAQAVIA
jgi:NitT/TauT family transport system ATP-binding protein